MRKFKFHLNPTIIKDALHGDQHTFSIISRSVLPIMRNISDKPCREIQNTHFMFNNIFFFENRAVYEIMWKKKVVEPDRSWMTIWRMRNACWIPKATNTHSHNVILTVFHCNNVTLHGRFLSCLSLISEDISFSFCNFIRLTVGQVSFCKTFQGIVTPNIHYSKHSDT